MENKKVTKRSKSQAKNKTIRVCIETFNKADRFVDLANDKKVGMKIKIDQVLNLALDLLSEDHIKKLKSDSLKSSDRQEIMRQKYIKQFGHISKEDYIGFTKTNAYADFLNSQNSIIDLNVAV